MSQEPIKLSAANTEKAWKLIKRTQYEFGKVMVKSFGMTVGATLIIAAISLLLGVLMTSFPVIAGAVTVGLIHGGYVLPSLRKIGKLYDEEIKKVIEAQKADNDKEAGLARPEP